MTRVVVDTNVLISALLKANSSPAKIVSLWRSGELEIVVSPEVVNEIERVLGYKRIRKRVTPEEAERFIDLLGRAATIMIPHDEIIAVEEDPDDNKFISLALSSHAEYIVSGDGHLLGIGSYQGIAIVTPAAFLARYNASQ